MKTLHRFTKINTKQAFLFYGDSGCETIPDTISQIEDTGIRNQSINEIGIQIIANLEKTTSQVVLHQLSEKGIQNLPNEHDLFLRKNSQIGTL